MDFLTNLNLTKNQLQNALMHPLGTPPSGVESQVYYNLNEHLLYVHNGTTWVAVGAPYTLPMASATVLGGIKLGTGLSIDGNGVVSISGTGEANIIESVKVNGTALTVTNEAVDILVATGSTNGTIKVNNVDIAVAGLASGAYAAAYVSPLTLTSLATGFRIAGGTTSKTFTVSNTLTLAGTDSSTLNIGAGGTLASGAFAVAYVHPTGDGNLHVPANSTTNTGKVLTASGTAGVYTWESLPADSDTATAVDNILEGSNTGTAITYQPYANKTAAGGASSDGKLYLGTDAPDGTTRLNYDGYFYATKLYSGGTEVSVSGHNHTGTYEPAVTVGSANQIWGINNAGNAKEWKSFSTPGTTGTAPNWVLSTANQINLHIPMASTGSVTAGLLSNTDYGKIHTQNTDTGTTGSSFAIDSDGTTNGVLLKTSSGELQLRNLTDAAYADLRVKNLYVEGTQTTINSNEVNIGDSQILLNADITTNASNSDGGIAVKRLMVDNTTPKNAILEYNNSTNKWQTTFGDVSGTLVTLPLTNKYTTTVGNATDTAFVITHNLNTRDAIVSIRETASEYNLVITDVEFTTVNTITVRFAVAPTTDQYTIAVVG